MRRHKERGQALLLVVLAMGIFLIGSLGLAIDGAQMYGHRQMAQAAADAAAQAGIQSIFNSTHTTGAAAFSTAGPFTCTTTDARTPCVYARHNGFGGQAGDTVTISFPTAAAGVPLWGGGGPDTVVHAEVQRQVPTTLMRLVGAASVANVRAVATAAIVDIVSPIPIIITHPTLSGALHLNGTGTAPKITICGGPPRSIQVNSSSTTGITQTGNPEVDLSHAGPNDPGDCTLGTGGDFGDFGGPATFPAILTNGAGPDGEYIQPASPILDPLATVPVPAQPANAPAPTTVVNGVSGCVSAGGCRLYSPGNYPTGISVQNENALFRPGLYYMQSGGFNMRSNSTAIMATGFADDPDTVQGMVVFNTGTTNSDLFNFVANAGADLPGIVLTGAPNASIYRGILFYQDPTAAGGSHIGTGPSPGHTLQGGGILSLTGTLYINRRGAAGTTYQKLTLQGNPGSTTTLTGQIIANALEVAGNAGVRMRLNPFGTLHIRQMALVR